jgi:acyl carrier protein
MDPLPIVNRIFGELFDIPVSALTPSTTREQIAGWDSVAHLKLLLMLEDEGISLDPDEAVSLHTVGDVMDAVRQRGSRSEGEP